MNHPDTKNKASTPPEQTTSVRMLLGFVRCLSYLPGRVIEEIATILFRTGYMFVPRMRDVGLRNLEIAYPEKSVTWRKDLLAQNAREMGKFVADTLFLPRMTHEWIDQNIEYKEFMSLLEQLKKQGKPIMLIGAHLGSFELVPPMAGILGHAIHSVARPFRSKTLDDAVIALRQYHGARVVSREGAIKKLKKLLAARQTIGILCDQNVTRKNAVFVPWFNTLAATTKAPGYLALEPESVVIAIFSFREKEKFKLSFQQIDVSDIRDNQEFSQDEKITKITQVFAKAIESEIKARPEKWFWIHRRWKTRPEGEPENFYANRSSP
jgi:KDO2-lipid IV(A) lauroyltransferase